MYIQYLCIYNMYIHTLYKCIHIYIYIYIIYIYTYTYTYTYILYTGTYIRTVCIHRSVLHLTAIYTHQQTIYL